MRSRSSILPVLALLLLAQTGLGEVVDSLGGLVVSLFAILLPGIVILMLVKAFVKLVRA